LLAENLGVVNVIDRNLQRRVLIRDGKPRLEFNTSNRLKSNIQNNFQILGKLRVRGVGKFFVKVGKFFVSIVFLILQILVSILYILITFIGPILVFAIWGYFKKFFGSKKKQVLVKIPYKGTASAGAFEGSLISVPERIYEGDYCLLDLDLSHNSKNIADSSSEAASQDSEDLQQSWETELVQLSGVEPYLLEFELCSPKFETDPVKKQSQPLNSDKLHYHWNCKVSGLGRHRLELLIKLVDSSNPSKVKQISREGWNVQVVGIPGISGNQFRILVSILPFLSFFLAIYTFAAPKDSAPKVPVPSSSSAPTRENIDDFLRDISPYPSPTPLERN
jgi:hypothetical protein